MDTATRKALAAPEFYFDNRTGSYWLKNGDSYLSLDGGSIKNHLALSGMQTRAEDKDTGLKDGDKALPLCQLHRSVDYAGPLAGHRAGIFKTQAGRRVLVTADRDPVPAAAGPMAELDAFLTQLFGPEQFQPVIFWLKIARNSLQTGDFRPGQMLCLAGPSGCGKSLFQSLVTEFLGGRSAKPYRYMTGATQFNADLASAEHLIIADEQASLDIRSRRNFGASIKDLLVNTELSIHAKGRDAQLPVPTFRRLTLSVNDEPENLAILPPMDESILDKITLLKCSTAEVDPDRKRTWKLFTGQLPALAAELDRMKIPPRWRDSRYGVKAYHNEELLEIVADISPETRLLNLVDEVIFAKAVCEWTGSAIELEKALRSSEFAFAVDKLLSFSSACGTYLARLRRKYPARFDSKATNGKTVWTIRESPRAE